ncbi:hypothetical protein V6N13_066119 [Hibiscus sabdariffa]
MCKCRSHGTFPLFGLQSSHLNICYYHQDLHRRPLRPGSRPGFYGDRRALLLIGAWPLPRRPGIGHALKRHPFSGLVDSADSLVRVSRRAGWGARRPTPGARWCRSTPRRRVLGSTIEVTTSPRAYQRPGLGPPPRSASVHAPSRSADRLSPFHIRPGRIAGPHPLPSRQFQALFDSLFKVLFIFPSRYLFAIGSGHDGALTLSGAPFQGTWARSVAEDASPDYNSDAEGDRFSSWAIPGSLAVTKGILAGFDNDPSAGSPTETLLRLLLPLNDKVQWTSRDVAGSEPPTSPRSEHFTGPFNRNLNDASPAQGPCDPSSYHESSEQRAKPASTFYLINASLPEVGDQPGSIPSRRPSRMVLNTLPRQGRGHNEAESIVRVEGQNAQATSEQGLDPTLMRYSASESTIEHRCTDVVESCRSTHSGHRARLRSTKQPQGHLTDKGWQYIRYSIDLGTQHRIPIAPLGLDGHKGRTLKSSAARQFDA